MTACGLVSVHRSQGAAHRAAFVGRELTQLGNIIDDDVRGIDYDADGSQSRKAGDNDSGVKPSLPAIRILS